MSNYLAQRIIDGLDYTMVVTKRPDLKDGIDMYLTLKERQDLIA